MNILEFAINMELEGERYYTEQAEKNKGNNLYSVFSSLADDERTHADILQKKLGHLSYKMEENKTLVNLKNVFKDAEHFKSDIKEIPNQLDFYKMALGKEKESIDLYKRLLSETTGEEDSVFYNFLISQEEEHYEIIDGLIALLECAESWVESAEFGVRDEY